MDLPKGNSKFVVWPVFTKLFSLWHTLVINSTKATQSAGIKDLLIIYFVAALPYPYENLCYLGPKI
jgi:hypothetical protein